MCESEAGSRLLRLRFWADHPALLLPRIRYWVWEKLNPGAPWLCPGTVRFCREHLAGSKKGLEFGSGRSTPWFARLAERLTSVEHSPEWRERVLAKLKAANIRNVDYLLIPLEHPEAEAERGSYDVTPRYVAVADRFADGGLDFVVVDGHYRTNCIRRAVRKIRAGGYLVVDDVNLWPSVNALPVPRDWRIVDDSTNGLKRSIIWQAP